jgi:ABC-three component (ABC-3C) system Middle Component 3
MAEMAVGPIPSSPTVVLNEAQLVQNTALGAVLIWLFVRSYNSAATHPCPLPLCFTVLPILFHHATRKEAESTSPSSPLSKFVEKFGQNREQLLAVHDRMLALRPLTLRSIQLACAKELISIAVEDAAVLVVRSAPLSGRDKPERLRPMLRAAEKLGIWYAPHTLSNISSSLRVFF